MLKAKHNILAEKFFKIYLNIKFKRNFSGFEVIKNDINIEKPMILIANHFSWWDGFWVFMHNNKRWNKKIHVMMLEDQLKENMILNKIGAFSIKHGSKDLINTLNYTSEVLSKKENLVVMYPQGVMNSLYIDNFKFNKGIEYIFKKLNNEININFAAFLIDYFDKPKPKLFAYFNNYKSEETNYKSIEKAYNKFYKECLNQQKSLTK